MAELNLVAEAGRSVGTRPARRMRDDGRIPAVVYGPGVTPIPVTVAAKDLRLALSTDAGLNAVLSLQLDGKEYLTMARELQRHPVRGTVIHVDFQVVDPNRQIAADVPITLVGEAVELHRSDGLLDQQLFSLPVKARPADIPTHLEVDITDIIIGSAMRVVDIALPDGVITELDPESVVVAGQAPRVATEEGAEGEGAEGEGAEGEGAAGATDSHDGGDGDRGRLGVGELGPALGFWAARRSKSSVDFVVVGLGNPGADLEGTRHNVGAEAVTLLARTRQASGCGWKRARGAGGARAASATSTVVIAVPQTYMNDCGVAVGALVRRYGIEDLTRLVVVHDELDLPSGRVKVKVGGGSAGHNGIKSIHAHLHDPGFVRVRIGIGKPPGRQPGAEFVLRRPGRPERERLEVAEQVAADAVEAIVTDGLASCHEPLQHRRLSA